MLIQRPSDRLMMLPGLGVQVFSALADGVTYLLRDEFTTDEAAPLTSPRTCEPGPGSWTLTQATGAIAIVSSQLEMTGTNAINSTRLVSVDSFARSAGLAMLVDKVSGTANAQLGWSFNSTGTWDQGVFAKPNGGVGRGATQQISPTIDDIMPSSVGYAIILRAAGAFVCYKSSTGVWGIGFVYNALTTTPVYAVLHHYQNTKNILDNARVVQMAGDWSTDYGITDVHATPAVSGTDYTGQANAIIDLVVTAPASLAGEAGYWFRKQDASNGYKAYFDSAGAFLVDRHVAGVPTNVVSVAGVITGSGTRTIRTIADGTALRFYTLSGTTWTQRGGTITDSSFGSQTTITPFADASWTGGGGSIGQLDSWPRTLSGAALAALNAV